MNQRWFSALAALMVFTIQTIGADSQVLPIGTVVASIMQASDSNESTVKDWLPSDGRSVSIAEYPSLFRIIGWRFGWGTDSTLFTTFSLPDLRGSFLRGASSDATVDPGIKERRDPLTGLPDAGIGSVQSQATALPKLSFTTGLAGKHDHRVISEDNASRDPRKNDGCCNYTMTSYLKEGQVRTSEAGEHSHIVEGGDAETRPKNVSVGWLIRVR